MKLEAEGYVVVVKANWSYDEEGNLLPQGPVEFKLVKADGNRVAPDENIEMSPFYAMLSIFLTNFFSLVKKSPEALAYFRDKLWADYGQDLLFDALPDAMVDEAPNVFLKKPGPHHKEGSKLYRPTYVADPSTN